MTEKDLDDPPASLRARVESRAFEYQTRMVHSPLHICPKSDGCFDDTERTVTYRDISTMNRIKKVSTLNVDDCRLFCWKDCAVYNTMGFPAADNSEVMHQVWPEWYAHRAMDKDLRDGSFFMKYMVFKHPVQTLHEISAFHSTLCRRLRELESEMPATKPQGCTWLMNPYEHELDPPPPAEYKLRPTFWEVFLVLDSAWREAGVLVVWKTHEAAEKHDCRLGEADVELYTGDLFVDSDLAGYDLMDSHHPVDPDLVFRVPLKRAMQMIVEIDPDRRVRRARYESEELVDLFGQGEDEDPQAT